MAYQVLARKWRPQRFDDVIGQPAVTRTLKNALGTGRIAHAFVFAGPRGVGKTTTARILAKALNCVHGPAAEPCGECEPCREIAEGRDIDVLEIDAATHTQVDNVREVIIAGLSIMPIRDRYKVFIIDEVHQLSSHSFNALLKSIEEPPPHVVFMMATTELSKIPETVLSRSQVYEFRTISSRAIADQLRKIADAEHITVGDDALLLIARAAEGSMRDAESALDQVIAFAGQQIANEDVATVLGLVGRDLVFDIVTAVADEVPAAAFELAGRAVELGYDLRLVCRELARVVRDMLVLSVDPSRLEDPEVAAESERERLKALTARFSREDLLRAFDVIGRAELEIRGAAQPRYNLEMALLRWIHMRKLVPLTELLTGVAALPASSRPAPPRPVAAAEPPAPKPPQPPAQIGSAAASAPRPPAQTGSGAAATAKPLAPMGSGPAAASQGGGEREAFLSEIRRAKGAFYNTVVAQAQKIDFGASAIVFAFLPTHRLLREQLEQNRPWLESIAATVTGRKIPVVALQHGGPDDAAVQAPAVLAATDEPIDLKAAAMSDTAVQAMLDVFPAEIEDVEEL